MSRSATPDYYELLGVARDADTAAITLAYRRLARVSHPDSGGNAGMFRLLRTAYETLVDDDERRAYDAALGSVTTDAQDTGGPADAGTSAGPTDAGTKQAAEAGPHQWEFDDETVRSLVVDPERLSWWLWADPDGAVRVHPEYRHRMRLTVLAAAVFLGLACGAAAVHRLGLVPAVAGAAAIAAAYASSSRGLDLTRVAAAAGVLTVVGTGIYAYISATLSALLLGAALLATLGPAAVLAHRFGRTVLLDRLAPPQAVTQFEYGRPGDGRAGDAGDAGFADRVGADALLPLTCLPGVRIFHGLAEPDGGEVVSHAVVCGRLVALVASRHWPPGSYAWTPHGALVRDGEHFPGGDLGLDTTVAAYRQALADSADDVRGFVLVAGDGPGAVAGGTGPTGLVLGDPQAVVDEIGAWFLRTGTVDLVQRRLLVKLYEHRAAGTGGDP